MRKSGEWHHRKKSGEVIDVEATSLDVSYDGEAARLALALDITNRKHAEDALKVQNNWLKSVLAHFPGGVTVADKDMRILEWNEQFRKLLDFPIEMFAGEPRTIMDFMRFNARRGEYGDVDVESYMAEAAKRINLLEPHHFERVRPDGTVLEVRGTPCLMAGSSPPHRYHRAQADRGATACHQPALRGTERRAGVEGRGTDAAAGSRGRGTAPGRNGGAAVGGVAARDHRHHACRHPALGSRAAARGLERGVQASLSGLCRSAA